MSKIIKIYNDNKCLVWIILLGLILRVFYLLRKSGDLFVANLGGDSCYHYNVAYNIANGLGPKTSFIFAYWFSHPEIPAYTDMYGPGYAAFLSLFLHLSDNFFNLRIASLILGILSILVIYFIGKKIHSKQLGLLSAFFIAINFFHIENSTVVMRELFNSFLTLVFFIILFYINKKSLLVFLIGIVTGYISITTGIWPIYLLILLLYFILKSKKISIKFVTVFSLGFLATSFQWILITKQYFGEFYYSNLKFYPYVKSWSSMTVDKGFPDISNFWTTINFQEYISTHFSWFINNLYKGSLFLTPTFVYFLFFLLLPLCFYGALKLKKNGFILLFFSMIYFFGLSFASYAVGGNLWPRYYLTLLPTISLLLASGIIPVLDIISRRYFNLNNNKIILSVFFISCFITLVGIEYKTSYWENKNHREFYEFGDKIKRETNEKSVIMYSIAVSDLWCATGRKVVQDIAVRGGDTTKRVKSEIDKYEVSHIFIDLSSENYVFSEEIISNILKNYHKVNLEEIFKDTRKGYFFYKINKN